MRTALFFTGSTLGSLAFQITVAVYPERFQHFSWLVKYVWIAWVIIWIVWLITHPAIARRIFGVASTVTPSAPSQPISPVTVGPITIAPVMSNNATFNVPHHVASNSDLISDLMHFKREEALRKLSLPFPKLIAEWSYIENSKTPMGNDWYGEDKPIVIKNVSQGINAFNVQILPLTIGGETAAFAPSIVTCLEGSQTTEFNAKIVNGSILRKNQLLELLGKSYTNSSADELYEEKRFTLVIEYELSESDVQKCKACCDIIYIHWKKQVRTGEVRYERFTPPPL